MRAFVNNNCIGCGICVSACPNVFKMTDSLLAEAVSGEIPSAEEMQAQDAGDKCPVDAIELT